MTNNIFEACPEPLNVDEVLCFLKKKWGVSYEMRILVRDKNIFLHIMWGFLEQKSFPDTEKDFRDNLGQVLEVINRLGQSSFVRYWLLTVEGRPKLGKALSLRLKPNDRFEEFLI